MKSFSCIEKKAEKAENYDAFSGFKLLHVKKKIKEVLSLVGRYEIFDQYTKHDISHIDQLLEMCEWVIPEETKERLTAADCLIIVLSIYFHDLGMLVTKSEYLEREKTGFPSYKNKALDGSFGLDFKAKMEEKYKTTSDEAEKFLYQEFIRMKHAERVKYWIQGKQKEELGISDSVIDEINGLLNSLPIKFRLDLGIVCESHHLADLDDFVKYPVSFPYGRTVEETANLHYAAIILRTVDLLHITSDRTPTTEFRLINPTDPTSQNEWIKQMAVSNVRPKPKKNKEGQIDYNLTKDTIEVTAFFDSPEKSDAFFSIISYLNYARKEIKQSNYLTELAMKEHGSQNSFPWKDINDDNVRTQGFERELFQFNLDQNKILNLLVGHTLYNDSTVVLRELIQNSIDAIRLYRYQTKEDSIQEIHVTWSSKKRILEITDTGTGMNREIIENHLLKVGSSRYQDERFMKIFPDFSPISRFGIGVLTCFLISNEIEITTVTSDASDALNLTIKDVDGKYLLRNVSRSSLINPINNHGTKISLKVRHDIDMQKLSSDIKKWILFPACKVVIKFDDLPWEEIGYLSPKAAIENYLIDLGYENDNSTIKVVEREYNGVVLAYALEYSIYFKEWRFMYIGEENNKNIYSPIGTAVEGIRVEFDTPGFRGKRLIAIANAKGKNAPKTNVARSVIEDTPEKNILLESIYKLYILQVKEEIDKLSKHEGFSITWAALETTYLLEPFFRSRRNEDKSQIRNSELLNTAINSINGVLIEVSKERKAVSPNTLKIQTEILTIDCDLYRSVENMLKEVKNNTSLSKVIGVLYGEESEDFEIKSHVLCGYDPHNILHQNALYNKEVVGFKLHHDKRRVDVIWKNMSNQRLWFDISKESTHFSVRPFQVNYFGIENIKIQIGEIYIEGLKDEIAIGAFYGTYLLKGTAFHIYVTRLIESLNVKNDNSMVMVLENVLSIGVQFLRSSKTIASEEDIDKNLEYLFDSKNKPRNRDSDLFWNNINRAELIDSICKTKWKTFDTHVWNRDRRYFF